MSRKGGAQGMKPGEFPTEVVDRQAYDNAVGHLRSAGVRLPTLGQLADPSKIPADVAARVASVDASSPDPENLFRVHWFNDESGVGTVATPGWGRIRYWTCYRTTVGQ